LTASGLLQKNGCFIRNGLFWIQDFRVSLGAIHDVSRYLAIPLGSTEPGVGIVRSHWNTNGKFNISCGGEDHEETPRIRGRIIVKPEIISR
jgi:hypothetical protein